MQLKSAVREIDWKGGNTFTDEALTMLKDEGFTVANGARKGVAQIGIVITDGNSTNPYKTREVAAQVLSRGIYMFAIGKMSPLLSQFACLLGKFCFNLFWFILTLYLSKSHLH